MITTESRKQEIINKFLLLNINQSTIQYKAICIQTHSNKKVCLCYERLKKPKISYIIVLNNDRVIDINKTVFEYLDTIPSNNNFIEVLKDFINLQLHARFFNKDYEHLNYLSNEEKHTIRLTELYIQSDYLGMIEEL